MDENLVRSLISEACDELKDLLLSKNAAYGNSALNPLRIFSKVDPIEGINVRIDDKLSRKMRGAEGDDGEDAEWDLAGYLVLKQVAKRVEKAKAEAESVTPSPVKPHEQARGPI